MRESAGHFDFGHFYFCPKMISARLSFSRDWKKTFEICKLFAKQFQSGFCSVDFVNFSFIHEKRTFGKNRIWTFFKFGSILYQEIYKICLKNTLQCCKGKSSKKCKPKYSEILEYFSWFSYKKTQIKHPTKI